MIRKLLITLGLIVVTVSVIIYLYLESGVRRRIEIAASSALGTPVTVSGVLLSPLSGIGSISELKVANPDGFSTPYAIELSRVDFEVKLNTIFSDVIEITSIVIHEAHISYETRLVTDNIRTLIDNIPSTSRAESAPADTPAGKRVIIRDFQIIDPQINVFALVGSAPIALPDLQIENIGESTEPSTIPEASREVLGALYRSLVFAGVPSLILGVGGKIIEGASRVGDAIENLTDDIRGLFNN